MTPQQVEKTLQKLEENWPPGLMLFAAPSGLLLLDSESFRIVSTFDIPVDGGDPYIVGRDGSEYLDLKEKPD